MDPKDVFDKKLLSVDYNPKSSGIDYEERSFQTHLFELYHENSKNIRNPLPKITEKRKEMLGKEITRDCGKEVNLPEKSNSSSLFTTIEKRKTVRSFSGHDIESDEIANILLTAAGERNIESTFRKYPSAGALYPVQLYWFNTSDNSIDKNSIARYNPSKHNLEIINEGNPKKYFTEHVTENIDIENISGFFIMTGKFWRSAAKYGERAYRYTLLECGHLAQNIVLASTEIGFDTVPIGGFRDEKLDNLLKLDGVEESTLYVVGVGKNE